MKTQDEVRRTVGEIQTASGDIGIITNKLLEISTQKVIPETTQKEMRSMSLETRGKVILCYIVAESLVEMCPAVMWKIDFVSFQLRYLAEVISKKVLDDLFEVYSKNVRI